MSPKKQYNTIKRAASIAGLALALGSSSAIAQNYGFNITNPSHNDKAGTINNITSNYDKDNQTLSFSTELFQKDGRIADGFWLVLNTGPNPKGIQDELAIFYLDASASYDDSGNATGAGPIVSAYGYNGANSSSSYSDPGVLLKTTQDGLLSNESTEATGDSSSRTLGFTLSVADINDAASTATKYINEGQSFDSSNWYGTGYGDGTPELLAGLWFHTITESEFTYDSEGNITNLEFGKQGFFDSNNTVVTVPEPSSTLLIGLGGALCILRRRRA